MKNKTLLLILLVVIIAITVTCTNKECVYTKVDYDYLADLILSERKPSKQDLKKYDFNKDGILNSSDYVALANKILEVKLTEKDMYRIKDIYLGNTVATDLDYKVYDLNNDGIIDGFDMMIIKRHFLDIEKIPNVKIIKGR